MKAMILAAGEGRRLRPFTLDNPKPLLPVAGVPLICYGLALLRQHGVREVVVNLHHNGHKIRDYLGDGSHLGMRVHYSHEETLLGTAGAVKRAAHVFDDTFLVLYGDVLTDCDLTALVRFHRRHGGIATIALSEVAHPWEAGIVRLGEDCRVLDFVEKPPRGSVPWNLANGGIYVLERAVIDAIPATGPSDFGFDVFPRLVSDGQPVYGYMLPPQTYLLDIGSPEKYRRATADVAAGRVRIVVAAPPKQRGALAP